MLTALIGGSTDYFVSQSPGAIPSLPFASSIGPLVRWYNAYTSNSTRLCQLEVLQAQEIAPRPQPAQPVHDTSKPDVKDIIVVEDEEIEFLYVRCPSFSEHQVTKIFIDENE